MRLIDHLSHLHRVKEEVDEVLGMKQEISYEDLGNLPYLTQVIYTVLVIASMTLPKVYFIYVKCLATAF